MAERKKYTVDTSQFSNGSSKSGVAVQKILEQPAPPKAPAQPAADPAGTDPDELQLVNVRLPQHVREGLQNLADAADMRAAEYMRWVVMAMTDPATDPALAEKLRRIEAERPRKEQVLKSRLNKGGGQMQGYTIRLPQAEAAEMRTRAEAAGVTPSLYLRYIFTALTAAE